MMKSTTNQDPVFVPIRSPPFQRIPTNGELPSPTSLNGGVFLHMQMVVGRDEALQFFSFLMMVMIFIPLCLRLKKRLHHEKMRRIRRCLQIVFTALNICWIVGCLILLALSAHIFFSNRQDKVDRIGRTFPWYIITILSCCLIEIIEAMFGLNNRDEETHVTRVINSKSTPLCKKSLSDDEKLLIA